METDKATYGRREFVHTVTRTVGASAVLMSPIVNWASSNISPAGLTVGQVISLILKEIPGAPFKETTDTLKSGSADQLVTGIVSTSFATIDVIEKTANLGANFIIAHEPTFYNHLDETAWLEKSDVYQYKHDLLKKYNIAVWRFHDYWHAHQPDGVQMGVLATLGWEKYADQNDLHVVNLPKTTMKHVVTYVKNKLGIRMVRTIGNPAQSVQRVAVFPGAAGGKKHIEWIQMIKPDICLVGEANEWETPEYIRDANLKGDKISLIVLGHALSEEPGMVRLVTWLQPHVPEIKITHIPANSPFSFM